MPSLDTFKNIDLTKIKKCYTITYSLSHNYRKVSRQRYEKTLCMKYYAVIYVLKIGH